MWKFIFGAFLILHGLVHMLYFGHSRRLFELAPGLGWPDGSWAFSRLLSVETARLLASVLLALAAVGFVVGGIGILAGLGWWRSLVTGSAALSIAIYLLFWNGQMTRLPDQGVIAILINLAILAAVLILRWPI